MSFIDVEGGRLHFETAGEGPAVTLIHPGLWNMRTWDRELPLLAAAGYRVIRYDIRGLGQSSRLGSQSYSHVRDLVGLLDALDVPQTALVGCSAGGWIALDFTIEHPEGVWALVPVASGLSGFEPLEEEKDWWDDRFAPIEAALERAISSVRRISSSACGLRSAPTTRPGGGSERSRSTTSTS